MIEDYNIPGVVVFDEHDLAFVDIPFNDSLEFFGSLEYSNKEINSKRISLKEFVKLTEVAEYDVFALSKNPYQRAFEMFKYAVSKNKAESKNISNFGIGKYFEEVLNNWNDYDEVTITTQTQIMSEINKKSDIQLFKCENLYETDLKEINEMLNEHELNGLKYFRNQKKNEKFLDVFDDLSFEVINYIFIEDFKICDYTIQNEIHTRKLSGK